MTPEQKQILESITKDLGGKIQYHYCSDLQTEHRKIVIEYGHSRKEKNLS